MQRPAKIGYWVGIVISAVTVIVFSLPGMERDLASGRMNTGHEALDCRSCHLTAPGTMRQQVQAKFKNWVGMRDSSADFGYLPVSNENCLECHARPNDKHPVSRFLEPRFAEARKSIQPQLCNSCHMEHNNRRVTINPAYCINCHRDLKLKDDPVNISHEQLAAQNNWTSCLACHDYHGNHIREAPTDLNKALAAEKIEKYFSGDSSPYSDKKRYSAKKEK
jgi:hypothetical protein